MAILIYLNILLRFLIKLLGIVFMGNKRSHNDISSDSNDSDNEDSDKTPTNEKYSEEGNTTPLNKLSMRLLS